MSGALTQLVVCIDDFGMHAGVNQAALELGGAGRVSAVGCMVDGPAWREGGAVLRNTLRGKADLGLHLDFTEPWPQVGPRPLSRLIVSAYAGRLARQSVADDIRRQLDRFEDSAGAPPDFVDGHQHVHQLPTIRVALLDELKRRYGARLPWIRSTRPPAGATVKAHIINLLGGAALRRMAQRDGFAQNRHLLGVYGFDGDAHAYRHRVAGWLAQAQSRDLLMCHPAAHGADALARARRTEYDFFRGDEFGALLLQHRVAVVRLSALNAQGNTSYKS